MCLKLAKTSSNSEAVNSEPLSVSNFCDTVGKKGQDSMLQSSTYWQQIYLLLVCKIAT